MLYARKNAEDMLEIEGVIRFRLQVADEFERFMIVSAKGVSGRFIPVSPN